MAGQVIYFDSAFGIGALVSKGWECLWECLGQQQIGMGEAHVRCFARRPLLPSAAATIPRPVSSHLTGAEGKNLRPGVDCPEGAQYFGVSALT